MISHSLFILLQDNNEQLLESIRGQRFFWLIVFALVAIIIVVSLFIKNLANKNKTAVIINKLKKRKADLDKIASDLFSTVAKLGIAQLPPDATVKKTLQELIDKNEKLYKFTVHHAEPMTNSRFLLVTNCHEKEVYADKGLDRLDLFLFVLSVNRNASSLELYSGIYTDLEAKLNREEFGRLLLAKLGAAS